MKKILLTLFVLIFHIGRLMSQDGIAAFHLTLLDDQSFDRMADVTVDFRLDSMGGKNLSQTTLISDAFGTVVFYDTLDKGGFYRFIYSVDDCYSVKTDTFDFFHESSQLFFDSLLIQTTNITANYVITDVHTMPNTYRFKPLEKVKVDTYNWSFGDGNFSAASTPLYQYMDPGIYATSLVITKGNCTDTNMIILQVDSIDSTGVCSADFGDSVQVSNPYTVYFTNYSMSSYNPAAVNVSYFWDFGFGDTSTTKDPVHTFTSNGIHNVCLYIYVHDTTAAHNLLCMDSICKTIMIPANVNCNANFTDTIDQVNPNLIHFYSILQSNLNPALTDTIYFWSFGDGGSSTSKNPSHAYMAPGVYNVNLYVYYTDIITGDTLCSDGSYHYVTVSGNGTCTASIADTVNTLNTMQIYFTGLCNSTYNPQTTTIIYQWNFGDGSYSSQKNPVKIYSNPGVYNVCLITTVIDTATGNPLCGDMTCTNVNAVANIICNASFQDSIDYVDPLKVHFESTSTYSGGPTAIKTIYRWSFGDGTYGTGANTDHTYAAGGPYNVCLEQFVLDTITMDTLCSDIFCEFIPVIGSGGCTAHYKDSVMVGNPMEVFFTNESQMTYTSGICDMYYNWDFGDGGVSYAPSPSHIYAAPGTYTVTLNLAIKDSIDHKLVCFDTYSKIINVNNIICNAKIWYEIDSFNTTARLVQFIDSSYVSTGTVTSNVWSFGDGTVMSNASNALIQYPSSQSYLVTLDILTSTGCTEGDSVTITIPDYYNIWGQVHQGYSLSDQVDVIMYRPVGGIYEPVDSNLTGQIGLFLFTQKIKYEYLLRVLPTPSSQDYGMYLPTYYGNSIYWKNSTQIPLISDTSNMDIVMVEIDTVISGTSSISGKVKNILMEDQPYTEVLILDWATEKPLRFVFTDSVGFFEFDDLPYGKYWLLAETPGLNTTRTMIQLNGANPVSTGNIVTVFEQSIGVAEFEQEFEVSVYPQPARDEVHITITGSAPGNEISCEVLDLSGKLIENHKITHHSGNFSLPVSGLNSGYYLLRLTDGVKMNVTKSIIVIKP